MPRIPYFNLPSGLDEWDELLYVVALAVGRVGALLPQAFEALQNPKVQHLVQEGNWAEPWQLLGMSDIFKAYHRDAITGAEAYGEVRRHGFDPKRYQVLHDVYKQRPDLVILLELLRRGKTSPAEARQTLKGEGIDPDWIDRMLELETRLPTQQEVLQWLVRDVFSSEVRTTLRLDDDFPESIVPYFRQLGLTEDHARNSWAAHWKLPSVTLSFEMFHRDLITEQQLEQILVAADILPSLRESVKAAAYRPLTRVDARRMHDMGVLSEDELLKAYKDIGYNDLNAQRLVDWTKIYNQDVEDSQDALETKELSRSQILRMYAKGLLSRPDSLSALQRIGYSSTVAEILALSADMDRLDEYQAIRSSTIRQQYKSSQLSYQEAVSLLAETGLEGNALELEVARLGAPQQDTLAEPTLGQLNRMVRQGLLPANRYLDLLDRQGYSKDWSGDLLESYGVGSTATSPRPEGRLTITEGYLAFEYDLDSWTDRMVLAGYPESWITHYTALLPDRASTESGE